MMWKFSQRDELVLTKVKFQNEVPGFLIWEAFSFSDFSRFAGPAFLRILSFKLLSHLSQEV